jgi:hypothetical protein
VPRLARMLHMVARAPRPSQARTEVIRGRNEPTLVRQRITSTVDGDARDTLLKCARAAGFLGRPSRTMYPYGE